MAAQSGLSSRSGGLDAAAAVPSSSVAETWSSLVRRQQRVVSTAGAVEARLAVVARTLASLGWEDPLVASRGPTMVGPEWAALAARQQLILRSICGVRDRVRAASFKAGATNPAYEEAKAKPQLARKVPSHFNNKQLAAFLKGEGLVSSRTSADDADDDEDETQQAATYPLTKLLAMVLVRDTQRYIGSGCHRAAAAEAGITPVALAAADASGATLRRLLQQLVWLLARHHLSDGQVARLVQEGTKLLILSLHIDTDTRFLLQDEPYLIADDSSSSSSSAAPIDNLSPSAAFTASLAAFHAKQSRSWFTSGVSPFADFKFTRPPRDLAKATRIPCPKCNKAYSLYCPFCMVPTLPTELQIPPVTLPLQVDIVHHVGENVKKSTSLHALILSPSHCRFLEYPHQLPAYDPAKTILLYPTSDAVHLDDARISMEGVERVVVIESTWAKSDVVSQHPSLAGLRRVKIRERESTFWRYQELGRHFLSTLEAIYYTCQEFQQRKEQTAAASSSSAAASSASTTSTTSPASSASSASIDDILYFYAYQHSLITDRYRSGTEAAPRSWSGGGQKKPQEDAQQEAL